jgi:hypothetical protein
MTVLYILLQHRAIGRCALPFVCKVALICKAVYSGRKLVCNFCVVVSRQEYHYIVVCFLVEGYTHGHPVLGLHTFAV